MAPGPQTSSDDRLIGRYLVCGEIASGGMATVHVGRLIGPVDFSRTVAIKRLHPHLAKDPQFVAMFMDEARLSASIRHPNVVPTIDIVTEEDELLVVMDYVAGESLARLTAAAKGKIPLPFAVSIVTQMLHGLHGAHETRDRKGVPLNIVHRDVSPQNVIVGVDGVARLLDFGIAKAASRGQHTGEGQIKGKLSYMSPEQIERGLVDRRADIFAASIVLWEVLTGTRLFAAEEPATTIAQILACNVEAPSRRGSFGEGAAWRARELDAIVLRGLARDPQARFATALEMATALEGLMPTPRAREVGAWVEETARADLARRAALVSDLERISMRLPAATSTPELRSLLEGAEDGRARSELPTEVTHVPVATPAIPPEPVSAPSRARGAALTVLALLGVGGLAFVLADRPRAASAPEPPASHEVTVAPPPPAEIAPSVAVDAAVLPGKPGKAHGGTRPRGRSTDCEVLYTVDDEGMKHFKPECL